MATYFARKAGNINATDVWATTPTGTAGPVTFTASDILLSNSFAITVNVSTTVAEVRNDTTGGATNGGNFILTNGVTLTANLYSGSSGGTVNFNGSSTGQNAYIVGSVYGPTSGSSFNGTIYSGGNGTINITGNVYGGTGGANQSGIMLSGPPMNITGNVYGGTAGNAFGCRIYGTSTYTITGNVFGSNNAAGIQADIAGTLTVIGTVTGGDNAPGFTNNNQNCTIVITRAKGNGFGPGSTGKTAQVGVASVQTGTVSLYEIEYGDLGQSPTSGPVRFIDSTSNVALLYRFGTTKKTLVDAAAGNGMPAVTDVRSGTSYNNGNLVGTCFVPSPSSVAFSVPVDNTTGTAVLTPAAVWDHLTSNISTSGSIGERLKNCATIASVGQQLSDVLSAG